MRTLWRDRPLAPRLFIAQALIVVSGAVTLVIVAVVVAPGIFQNHLSRAIGPISTDLAHHLDEALARALLLSLAVAVSAALLTTLAVSLFITRRLVRPIASMAAAATRIAGGDHHARVPTSRLGLEFATLDTAFNQMAATIERTEQRRQELLADVAHELRTPLSTVDSFLEGIEDGVVPASPDTWRTLREQTARMRRLVGDIDALSSAEERPHLRPQHLTVDRVAAEAVRCAAASYASKGVRLQHRASRAPADAWIDPDRIREILDNLLGNALRHTPLDGDVTVTTEAGTTEVRITVADTGVGIAAHDLPRIFDRFYRADPARDRATGGSGIGLTIARALAQAHGGDLRAASNGIGHGSQFTLILPAARVASTRRNID